MVARRASNIVLTAVLVAVTLVGGSTYGPTTLVVLAALSLFIVASRTRKFRTGLKSFGHDMGNAKPHRAARAIAQDISDLD